MLKLYIGWCGGIGRRKGLKIPRWQHRAGSSPATSSLLSPENVEFSGFFIFKNEQFGVEKCRGPFYAGLRTFEVFKKLDLHEISLI